MVQCCFLIATLYSLRAVWGHCGHGGVGHAGRCPFLNGVLVVPVDLNAFFAQPVAWLLMIVAVTLVPAIIFYVIGDYQRMIAALLRRVEDKRKQLETMSRPARFGAASSRTGQRGKSVFSGTHDARATHPPHRGYWMLEIADKRNHDPDLNRVLMSFRHSAGVDQVINDVLDYSKLDAGKITLQPETFDLAEFLHNAGGVSLARAKKGIEFKGEHGT